MPINLSSPGVSIQEIDKSATINTENSKIAIIALPASKGVTNKVTYISNEAELVEQFGKPDDNNYIEWFSALEVMRYGVLAGVIRPNDSTTALKTANVTSNGFDSTLSVSGMSEYELNTNNYIFSAQSQSDLYNGVTVAVIDHGADQILTINVGTNPVPTIAVGDIVKTITSFGWVYSINTNGYTVTINDPTKKFNLGETIYLVDGITPIGVITGITDFYNTQNILPGLPWSTIAPQPGTSQKAKDLNSKFDEFHAVIIDTTGKISGNINAILESYTYLSKASDGTSAEGVDTYWKRAILNRSKYIFPGSQKFNIGTTLTPVIPANATYIGADIGDQIAGKIFRLFRNSSSGATLKLHLQGGTSYNWLLPTVVESSISSAYDIVEDSEVFGDIDFLIPGKITTQRILKLLSICERRRDCRMAVAPAQADVLNSFSSNNKVNRIINFFDTLPSSSFMIFCDNYKYIYDKYNNTFRYIPCSADVAGLTLSTLNSWQSPAGVTHGVIKNAIKLAYSPKRSERDQLYSHRVNSIISYPGRGVILNGDKTALSSPSAFDRIGVRGLMIELQRVISQFAENQLFEINDDNSRKNFLDNVTPYLQNIQANRGIYEYQVIADTTNNSVQDIDANKFTADIYIKPARSINFIVLNFIVTATGASFTET
jgi:hypothetical protein